ncbi:DUF2726 domain-containing protein [Brachyspira pulli]|uniref:DUF2726 domain-containing protein n=1 Tax=Brachyspira pulli TaxID=310721 RepID=UPI0030078592
MLEVGVAVIILSIVIIFFFSLKKTYSTKESNTNENKTDNYEEPKEHEEQNKEEFKINAITEQRLKYMDTGSIKTKRVLNIEETRIFYSMVKILNDYNVNPQVSFRAFLKGEEDTDAWKTFRDFYCDFLITYKRGSKMNEPAAVIEYHGGGHFGDTEEQREKVKNNDMIREKLFNKIGLKYFIIRDSDIKMDSGLIDEEKLSLLLKDVNTILSNTKES